MLPSGLDVMPPSPAGHWPGTSSTARPAEKGTEAKRPDAAAVRMAVNGLTAVSRMRRKEARALVLAYASDHGPELDGWAHWLRNWQGISDPTGESVARRLGGGRHG